MLSLPHRCMLWSLSCWPSHWGKCRHAVKPSLETMQEFTSCIEVGYSHLNDFSEGPHCKGAIEDRAVEIFSFVVTGEVCGLQMPSSTSLACSGRPEWINTVLSESPKNEVVLKKVKAYSLLMCLDMYVQIYLHMHMYTYIYTHSETHCYQKNYKYQMRAEQLELDWHIVLYCSDSAQEYLISS